MKTLKNGQKQGIKFDRKCKNAKHTVDLINKYGIYQGLGGLFSIS